MSSYFKPCPYYVLHTLKPRRCLDEWSLMFWQPITDHTKNFSFRLKQNQKRELEAAYDVCYSYDPTNIWVSQHTFSINAKHKQITRDDLMSIAKANNIKKGETIIKDISNIVSNWKIYANNVGVEKTLAARLRKNSRL